MKPCVVFIPSITPPTSMPEMEWGKPTPPFPSVFSLQHNISTQGNLLSNTVVLGYKGDNPFPLLP